MEHKKVKQCYIDILAETNIGTLYLNGERALSDFKVSKKVFRYGDILYPGRFAASFWFRGKKKKCIKALQSAKYWKKWSKKYMYKNL